MGAHPEIGLTGVAMLLEPGTSLLGVMPMSTDSTSKGTGGLLWSSTIIPCRQAHAGVKIIHCYTVHEDNPELREKDICICRCRGGH